MTNAMDNKERAKLFLEHAKYCMQIKNYEKAEALIHYAQKLYPTKEAEELLAELLRKKELELADQEQGQERNSEFNWHWSREERWQNTAGHQYYESFTKFKGNMTDKAVLILAFGLGAGLGTSLLAKYIFDAFNQQKRNKY